MSFLHADHEGEKSGAGKLVVGALAAFLIAGGVYWFVTRSPAPSEPQPRAETAKAEPEPPPPPEPKAEAPAPDLPATGSLSVRANVDGATVYVDGERAGEAPYLDEAAPPGRHEIRVEKEGYQEFVDTVRVRRGRRANLRARLEPVPPSLRVDSDVPGATVFLDREYKGTTPVEIRDVTPGDHQLTVSAEGYEMHADTVSVTAGRRDIMIRFQEAPRDFQTSIAVIHKHGFGKCQGVLIADAHGIRYETDNKKDGFSIPYTKLERFEVDYIKKNLNLKIKGGKNYNFTEQSGDADALFVFHKDVKAYMDRM